MSKKLLGLLAVVIAVVLGIGGLSAYKYNEQVKKENIMIAEELSKVMDFTVMEGEVLPPVDETFADTTMIDKNSIEADIQNVDVTVPGIYEVIYYFNDMKGQKRSKSVTCTVKANLIEHVEGIDDIRADFGEELKESDITYDEYIDSVVRDDSMVDIMEPGTYPITYTILGTDGEMDVVEKKCVIYDTRPSPTPTPVKVIKEEIPIVETGNVENTIEKDYTVETKDSNITCFWFILFGVSTMIAWLLTKKKMFCG